MAEENNAAPAGAPKKGYGKRPFWQWLLLYVVIGGIVYALVYYLFMRGDGSSPAPASTATRKHFHNLFCFAGEVVYSA